MSPPPMLDVVLLWHMHQPLYADPETGVGLMPWVRLHAVKGYLDMIHSLRAAGGTAAFNFTPVLLRQIQQANAGGPPDLWYQWSRKPAGELTDAEQSGILQHFFHAHREHLIRPHPRYWQLLQRRGLSVAPRTIRTERGHFSAQDFLDLQVWFNLAWCGFTAESLFPELRELKLKGSQFTESEKNAVLDIHDRILARLIDDYREAETAGCIETTTTPFYHPILPLVIDSDLARRCMPARALPRRFQAPDDARLHIERAVQCHEACFGRRPTALWPAEGSVAPEILPLLRDNGIRLFFTDEAVLFHSITADGRAPQGRNELFHPWRAEHEGAQAAALFRERSLSDFIGFNAARNRPETAVRHLLHHIQRIADASLGDDAVVTLILDGENAWENFSDGGKRFLRLLYEGLASSKSLRPALPTAFVDAHPPSRSISRLHTGSWIGADFDIWIGDEEENRAWDHLGLARDFLESRKADVAPDDAARAREALLAAEGSDWFWWFGPDFQTDLAGEFDDLFRRHLQAVYRRLGAEPPAELLAPIRKGRERLVLTRPSALIAPNVNGRVMSFFEYFGAGHYDSALQSGAMHQAGRQIQGIWFGNDSKDFFLRVDLAEIQEASIDLEFPDPEPRAVRIPVAPNIAAASVPLLMPPAPERPIPARVAVASVVEAAFPLLHLSLTPGQPTRFALTLSRGDIALERHPANGFIECPILPAEDAWQDWLA